MQELLPYVCEQPWCLSLVVLSEILNDYVCGALSEKSGLLKNVFHSPRSEWP